MYLVPPRKATKRPRNVPVKTIKSPKQPRRKQEVIVKPKLRSVPAGGIMLSVGQGDTGQLGLGEDVVEKTRPAAISGYADVIMIAAGGMHNVCLTKSGKVLTFGCNDEGALGRDTSKEGSETIPGVVDIDGNVIQVTAGDSHSAALLNNGQVYAWGSFRDSHGSMGLTISGNERLPVAVLSTIKIVKIASGADHLVMLSENGRIYTCGCGEQGQLGRVPSRTADRHNRHGIENLLKPSVVEFKVTKKLYFNDIWAGQYCTFAKEISNGDIYVFGLNNYHQIGLEETIPYFHPRLSKTFNGRQWQHICSGQHHTLALDDDGTVYVMGRKDYGRLGLGSDCSDAKELIQLENLDGKFIDIATGSAQSFAVNDSGQLYAWGMGSSGQLGTGEEDDVDVPILVKSKQLEGKFVVQVSGGGQHTLMLASSRLIKEKIAG